MVSSPEVAADRGEAPSARARGPAPSEESRPRVGLLTPAGRGAIAVVRVAGAGSVAIADSVFRPHRGLGLAETASGRIRLGRIGQGLGDEVVAVVLDQEPAAVELQCHGGVAAVELVIDALEAAGAKRCDSALLVETSPGDLIAAEATLDLCQAPTLKTAEILLEQAEGALRRELHSLIQLIDQEESTSDVLRRLDALLDRSSLGSRLLTGWKVVIIGRPNVGKSRLLNALAGFTRAIVDPTPGTTRDVVTLRTALEGWPIELSDTAGLRAAGDPIEAEGIARSRQEQARADLSLLVLDRSLALDPVDRELVATACHTVVVANKSDLPAVWLPDALYLGGKRVLTVSAERGDGIAVLCREIVQRLIPVDLKPGDGVPFRPTHVLAIKRARQCQSTGDRSAAKAHLESLVQS